ncbi:MAG: ABC transporter ATP-binding protein [Actinomycetes bacterium]
MGEQLVTSSSSTASTVVADQPVIAVTSLTVRYGAVTALREVSLEVGRGEIVGVLGPNGAGKSTLMRTIAGVHKPVTGQVLLEGRPVVGGAPEKAARAGLRLVPEGRRIFGPLTVEENLRIGSMSRGSTLKDDLEAAYDRFPILGERRSQSAGTLSGGEQQQLAIARALMAHPTVILYDEPSLGLAPRIVDQIFELIAHLRDEGVTSVLVEQNARLALDLSDRAYVLGSGSITASGKSSDLAKIDLAQLYLGKGAQR